MTMELCLDLQWKHHDWNAWNSWYQLLSKEAVLNGVVYGQQITPETYRSMVSYASEIDNDLPQTKLFRHVDKAPSRCRFIRLFE